MTKAVVASVKEDILPLVGATDFRIVAENGEGREVPGQGICTSFILNIPSREQPLGEVHLYSEHKMKKDDKALMRVITPYISWTLENGLAFISLGDERKRLEKEQYVHEQHLAENKRQNREESLFVYCHRHYALYRPHHE